MPKSEARKGDFAKIWPKLQILRNLLQFMDSLNRKPDLLIQALSTKNQFETPTKCLSIVSDPKKFAGKLTDPGS